MAIEKDIKTWRNPYDCGFSTTRLKNIIIKSGITVLVGCNGAGKTTLIKNITEQLKKENTPYYVFDNLYSGGKKSISKMVDSNNIEKVALMLSSSEGENITNNICDILEKARCFIKTGDSDVYKTNEILKFLKNINQDEEEPIISNERWFLFDAIDSGYSIDNIVEFKEILNLMILDSKKMNKDLYIIISANSYEMANNENCFDVMSGKYIRFENYDEYKKFIIKSRKRKEKRYLQNKKGSDIK